MDLNKVSVSMIGAVLLLSNSAFNAASAQGTGDSSNVVLPGDVPIKGSSSRGWHPAPGAVVVGPGVVVGSAVVVAPAGANDALVARGDQLNARLQAVDTPSVPTFGPGILPGVTYNTPSAYGGYSGMGAIGIAYQSRVRRASAHDGVAGLVLSFGSPRTVGVDAALNFLNLTGRSGGGGFGKRLSGSFKIHKPIGNNLAVAFGGDNVLQHNGTFDLRHSYYGVVTKGLILKPDPTAAFSRLDVSLGVGSGRFQTEKQVFAGKRGTGVFGSVALQASQRARPFAEWTGQELNLGVSLVPFGRVPIVVTPAFADVAHRAGNGTRFTIGVAYQFHY